MIETPIPDADLRASGLNKNDFNPCQRRAFLVFRKTALYKGLDAAIGSSQAGELGEIDQLVFRKRAESLIIAYCQFRWGNRNHLRGDVQDREAALREAMGENAPQQETFIQALYQAADREMRQLLEEKLPAPTIQALFPGIPDKGRGGNIGR